MKTKSSLNLSALAGTMAVSVMLAGCATGPDYDGPRPGDVCYVSTEELPVRSSPDGLAPTKSVKKYRDQVTVKSVYRAARQFSGDKSLFPESLIPCWVEIDGGFVPVRTLVSENLINNQNPDERISNDGMIAAKRGFSEDEDGDMSSMRGAAGGGKFLATADYTAVENLYLEQRKHKVTDIDIAAFIAEGALAGNRVEATRLPIGEKSSFSKMMTGFAQDTSSALKGGSNSKDGQSSGGGLASAALGTAADLVYSESGPVQAFQMGEAVAAKVLPAYERVLPQDDPRCAYIAKLANALAAASNDPMPYRGLLVCLVETKEVNAFAIPGGFLIVTTGMLDFLNDEDELAAIIGHEVGHLELNHGMKAVGTEKILKLFSMLKETATSSANTDDPLTRQMLGSLKEKIDEVFNKMFTSIRNGYGVEIESQADWRSLQLCDKLGYDTMALYNVLERFKSVKGTYGGAGYPEERGADILKYRREFAFGDEPAKGRSVRSERYRQIVGK